MTAKMRIVAGFALGAWSSLAPAMAQSTLVVAGYGGSTETVVREKILPEFEKARAVAGQAGS